MENNPYQPPAAAVTDQTPAVAPPPAEVRRALRLLWWSLVISLVSMLPTVRPPVPGEEQIPTAVYLGVLAFFCAVFAALIVLIGRRYNWARWAMLAYLALGWFLLITDITTTFTVAPAAAILDVVVAAMEIYAASLLFTKPGSNWFKS